MPSSFSFLFISASNKDRTEQLNFLKFQTLIKFSFFSRVIFWKSEFFRILVRGPTGGQEGHFVCFSSGVSIVSSRCVLFITAILFILSPFFTVMAPKRILFLFFPCPLQTLYCNFPFFKYSQFAPHYCLFFTPSPLRPPFAQRLSIIYLLFPVLHEGAGCLHPY